MDDKATWRARLRAVLVAAACGCGAHGDLLEAGQGGMGVGGLSSLGGVPAEGGAGASSGYESGGVPADGGPAAVAGGGMAGSNSSGGFYALGGRAAMGGRGALCSTGARVISRGDVSQPGTDPCSLRFYQHLYCYCDTDTVGCGAHGQCVRVDDGDPSCQCATGYTGTRCDTCDTGLVDVGGGCVTPCAAAALACLVHSTCQGTVDSPACVCVLGYTGASCDTCVPGYELQQINSDGPPSCVALCPVCAPGSVCDPAASPPSCVCNSAYAEVEGQCLWKGDDLALPPSVADCGRWAFYQTWNMVGAAVTVEDGSLVLTVSANCLAVVAAAWANLPDSSTFASPALRVTLLGNEGAELHVAFQDPTTQFGPSGPSSGVVITATGAEQIADFCLPTAVQGTQTSVMLWVSAAGICDQMPQQSVAIRALEFVSAPDCL